MTKHVLIVGFFALLFSAHPAFAKAETVITLHAGDTIIAEGDSLTYGQDYSTTGHAIDKPFNGSMNFRSNAPYPETLQKLLHDKIIVINHGYPGDRTTEGLQRWATSENGALTLIMYGSNDCWNYGNYPSGIIGITEFKQNLKDMVKRRTRNGAHVILLTPPPIQNTEQDKGLIPYRDAVREVGKEMGLLVENAEQDLKSVTNIWCDGVHLSLEANRKIAEAVATHLQVQ